MIFTLYSLELLKLRHRLSTFTIYMMHIVLLVLIYGSMAYSSLRFGGSYRLPEAWPFIFENAAQVSGIFSAALLVILTASEFEWRTARQHVIDGMTRMQWFTAKCLLGGTLAAWFFLTQFVFAVGLALIDTDLAAAELFGALQVSAFMGVLLSTVLLCALGLLCSVLLRSTGTALGLTLIYPIFDNIFARVLRGYELDGIADWLLFQVVNALIRYDQHRTGFGGAERALAWEWSTPALFAAGCGWLVVLGSVACGHFAKKDL
jgi:ABC-2 type transport system permease protein